ncbi:hypothetical protein F4824DRAFT_505928 [Ustulina deusta]|nr:hypothetical protein F4824DRAFT_505928 [Ustulina deusta]
MPWKLPTAPKHSEITLQMAIIDPEVCVGASTQVKYSPSSQDQKLLYPAQGQEGLSAWYFQWHPEDGWSNVIEVPGPDSSLMTTAGAAWNGDDMHLDLFAVSRSPGVINVFALGGDAGLWHISYDDNADGWSN